MQVLSNKQSGKTTTTIDVCIQKYKEYIVMFVILVGVTDHRMNIFLGFYLVKKELRAEDFMHTNLCCKVCKNWLIRISLS